MNVHLLWVVAIALALTACSEQQTPAQPEESEEPQVAAPAIEAEEPDELQESAEPEDAVSQEFIYHMHAHADQMDELMFALSDGDLDRAMTPAYWLSRHKTVEGVPEDWRPHVIGMREAALAVESATDIDAARAAAEQISVHCQGCHAAAGVMTP